MISGHEDNDGWESRPLDSIEKARQETCDTGELT